MRVRLVDLSRLHAPIRAELDAAWLRVTESGRFILGEEVHRFEEELAASCGVAHAAGTSSGSDALLTALMAMGIGPGDEVITPAFSFVAAAEAILRVGAKPVFADVGPDFNVDPADALVRVSSRTRAILVVDLFGLRSATRPFVDAGLPVLEDAAQAIGARGVGEGVRAAVLSFFPTKNLGALGDGGAVVTSDVAMADSVRKLRAHGSSARYVHEKVGGNFRLDALQAAILRAKLPHLPRWTEARQRIAELYLEELRGVPGVVLPRDEEGRVWHQFVIRAARRDELQRHLAERGVETEVYYPLALHQQPCFAHLGPVSLPGAERAAREALALPIHAALEADEIGHVIEGVKSFRP